MSFKNNTKDEPAKFTFIFSLCTRIISSKNNVNEVEQFGMIFSKLRFTLSNILFRDKYAKDLQYSDQKQARVQTN